MKERYEENDVKSNRINKQDSVDILDDAIASIQMAQDRAEMLLQRINPRPEKTSETNASGSPITLRELMQTGAPRIRNTVDRIIHTLNEIENSIFEQHE